MVPEHHSNRSTGFAIGFSIGKIVVLGKSFIVTRRTNSAGEVHVPVNHVFPDSLHRFQIVSVMGHSGNIGRAAVQIHRTNSMPSDFSLLLYWCAILAIISTPTERPDHPLPVTVASLIQIPLRQL